MADYERAEAREWSQAATGPTEPVRRVRLIPRLPYIPDTAARTSWRNNEPPVERYSLPLNFVPVDRRRQHPHSRSRNRTESPFQLSQEIGEIAYKTTTEITVSAYPNMRAKAVDVLIWGEPANAKRARDIIHEWVQSYASDSPDKDWAKIENNLPDQRAKLGAKIEEQSEREKFRRAPPEDAEFLATGSFEWRADYDTPHDVLGRNLEACDPIRTDHSCYIKLEPGSTALKVMGQNPEEVKKALARLRGAFFQTVARERGNQTRPRFLLGGLSGIPRETTAALQDFLPGLQTVVDKGGRNAIGKKPCLLDVDFPPDRARFDMDDVKAVEKFMTRTIATLQYFKGNLQMQARLGTFVLKKYKDNVNTLAQLLHMLQEEGVEGDVYGGELGISLEDIKDRLGYSISTMVVGDAALERPEKLRVRPTLSTTFALIAPRGSDVPLHFKLDVKYAYDDDGNLNCVSKVWSQLGADPTDPTKVLDICLIDLERNATSWNLEIKATDVVNETKNSFLQRFADSVRPDPRAVTDRTRPFMTYKAEPGLILQQLMQKQTWSFEHGHTGYVCDVTRRRAFALRNAHSMTPNQHSLDSKPEQIDVSISSQAWDIALAGNAKLAVGRKLPAGLDLSALFPQSSGGVAGFLQILGDFWSLILD